MCNYYVIKIDKDISMATGINGNAFYGMEEKTRNMLRKDHPLID